MHESELGHTVAGIVVLLIIAAATQKVCKHFKLPLTIILVLIGIGLAWAAERFPEYVGLLSALKLTKRYQVLQCSIYYYFVRPSIHCWG